MSSILIVWVFQQETLSAFEIPIWNGWDQNSNLNQLLPFSLPFNLGKIGILILSSDFPVKFGIPNFTGKNRNQAFLADNSDFYLSLDRNRIPYFPRLKEEKRKSSGSDYNSVLNRLRSEFRAHITVIEWNKTIEINRISILSMFSHTLLFIFALWHLQYKWNKRLVIH